MSLTLHKTWGIWSSPSIIFRCANLRCTITFLFSYEQQLLGGSLSQPLGKAFCQLPGTLRCFSFGWDASQGSYLEASANSWKTKYGVRQGRSKKFFSYPILGLFFLWICSLFFLSVFFSVFSLPSPSPPQACESHISSTNDNAGVKVGCIEILSVHEPIFQTMEVKV